MIVSELIHKLKFFPSDAKVHIGRGPLRKQLIVLLYRAQKDAQKKEIGPGRLYIYNELEERCGTIK